MEKDQRISFIADYTMQLSVLAEDAGKETLAYILRMAELEARNLITTKEHNRKTLGN